MYILKQKSHIWKPGIMRLEHEINAFITDKNLNPKNGKTD